MAAISEEEFSRLQMQLLELRTQNYELSSKLQKSEIGHSTLNEKCSNQEKELQKLNRVMKFPGFQAITKSKSKKDITELIEENDRLNQQLTRQEDDFKLQIQTLLQEVSWLTSENEKIKQGAPVNEEYQQLREELEQIKQNNKNTNVNSESPCADTDVNANIRLGELCEKHLQNLQEHFSSIESSIKNDDYENNDPLGATADDAESRDESTNNKSDNANLLTGDTKFKYEDILEIKELLEILKQPDNIAATIFKNKDCTNGNDDSEVAKLKEKLRISNESLKSETNALKDEVIKWEEKVKKKQTSYLQLQDEKEKMYEENRIALSTLKEEHQNNIEEYKTKLAQLENTLKQAENSDQEELFGKIDILRNENSSLQNELISLRELQKENLAEKCKQIQETVTKLEEENTSLKIKVQSLQEEISQLQSNNTQLLEECQRSKAECKQANELCEKRKILLDESSKELHSEVESHRSKLDQLKNNYEGEINTLVLNHKNEIDEMKGQIVNHKKLKKDLEEAKQLGEGLQTTVVSLEEKSSWLKRTLDECEEKLKSTEENHIKETKELKSRKENEINEITEKLSAEKQELEVLLKSADEERESQTRLSEKLNQAIKDKEVEHRISNKKNEQLIKDLKRQLISERKRADQAQSKLQDFIRDIKVKNTYDELFNPESLQLKSAHRRTDSGSHLSLVSSLSGVDGPEETTSPKSASPTGSSSNILNLTDETVDLISRVADLQQEKWVLEEKVRHLEESASVMADDLVQKSQIIQKYVMNNPGGDSSPNTRPKTQSLKEKMLDKLKLNTAEELAKERASKLQRLLEETLAKNLSLQKEIDLLNSTSKSRAEKS